MRPRYEGVEYEDTEESNEGQGQRKLCQQSVVQTCLSCVAVLVGVISVILMANNKSFPAFTLSPAGVGLLGITTGTLGIVISRLSVETDKDELRNRNAMFIHYLLNVLTATLSCIGTVYSCICGALCTGMQIVTSNGFSDVEFCKPNTDLSSVFAFVNGGLCMLVGLWSMRGVCFSCYYGRMCGLNSN